MQLNPFKAEPNQQCELAWNVQMVLYAGFVWWFYQRLYKKCTFFALKLNSLGCSQVGLLLTNHKSKKTLACDALDTFPKFAVLFRVVIHTDCCAQNGSPLNCVFIIFNHWVKNCCVYGFYSIPIRRACGATLGRFPCQMHPHNQRWSEKRGGHQDSLTFPWTVEGKVLKKMVFKEDCFFVLFSSRVSLHCCGPDSAQDVKYCYLPTVFLSVWSRWISLIFCKLKFRL